MLLFLSLKRQKLLPEVASLKQLGFFFSRKLLANDNEVRMGVTGDLFEMEPPTITAADLLTQLLKKE